MIVLDNPSKDSATRGAAPPQELTKAFREWRNASARLVQQAQSFCSRFPQDRDARFLLAESLRGAGMDDLAATEYDKLLEQCPVNELRRVEQGLAQCRA